MAGIRERDEPLWAVFYGAAGGKASVDNLAVRQRPLKILHASVSDFRTGNDQSSESSQALEMPQASVGYAGGDKGQVFERADGLETF